MDFTLLGLICAIMSSGFLGIIWQKNTFIDSIIKLSMVGCTVIEIMGLLQYLNAYYPNIRLW